jgi:hypothetical protein
MSWRENGYIFYGRQTLSHTARSQGRGTMLCWCYAFGAILDTNWSGVALFSDLNALSKGQSPQGINLMVEAINKDGRHGHLRALARWHGADWGPAQLEQNFPQATLINGHVVVALAIGKADPPAKPDEPAKPDLVRYWDPGDAQIHIVSLAAFTSLNPHGGFIRG